MDKKAHRFSIFLPVKNGGSYLPLCVESILTQNYRYFDLIILENQSTDGTAEWLQALERKDSRIKVIPSDIPLSIEDNWKRILSIPKNEFMTIIGHDDVFEPNFLDEINNLIQSDQEANLYLTHFKLIDKDGEFIMYCTPIPRHETAAEFLAAKMADIRNSFGTGYVMRSKLYDEVGGIPTFPSLLFADDAFWVTIIGASYKATSPQVCFSYRYHTGSTSATACQVALFAAFKQYLYCLRQLAVENTDIDRVLELYGPQYVAKWCKNYYCYLVQVSPWVRKVDREELMEIERIMKEFSGGCILDITPNKLQMILWRILVTIIRRIVPLLGKNVEHKLYKCLL